MPQPRVPDHERFWPRVDLSGGDAACWEWTGWRDRDGYGCFSPTHRKRMRAHRWIYEEMVGPIPDGLTIDHLCRNRGCVNPAHMEPVTVWENTMRGNGITARNRQKTHCKHGHSLSGWNLIIGSDKGRRCRICMNRSACLYERRRRARKRAAA